MTNTISFRFVCGTAAGYGGDELLTHVVGYDDFCVAYLQAAQKVMEKTGVYVSASVVPSRVLYSPDWGCPTHGEPVYTVTGSLNPMFGEATAWKQAVLMVAQALKTAFNQSTVTVEFFRCEVDYLAEKD